MKTIACLIILAGVTPCPAQIRPLPHGWNCTVRVIDETGQSVPGAQVRIDFSAASPQGDAVPDHILGLTDTNGIFVASHVDRSVQLDFQAQKAGYYRFAVQHYFGFANKNDSPDWSPSLTLVLKRIRQPVPLYAKSVNLGMPVYDRPAGFDLMVGDWVAPYGKGRADDIIFTARRQKRAEDDSDYTLTVTFPKTGDGIREFSVPAVHFPTEGSQLRSPHEAPESGFLPEWVQTLSRRPGRPLEGNWDRDRNYFFRVRTVLDEKGNVKSALYGKVYGDFMQFTYYLNPVPNDRNVEFDPRQNLLKNLKRTEMVSQP